MIKYLDLAILWELVVDVVLLGLLVDARDKKDPPLNTPLRSWLPNLLTFHSLVLTLPWLWIDCYQFGRWRTYFLSHFFLTLAQILKNQKELKINKILPHPCLPPCPLWNPSPSSSLPCPSTCSPPHPQPRRKSNQRSQKTIVVADFLRNQWRQILSWNECDIKEMLYFQAKY